MSSFEQSAANLSRAMREEPILRAVNFHNTPRTRRDEYRAQLLQLGRDYAPVTERDLDQFLVTGHWPKGKPGVIISVYEGYRNGFDVLAPLLEEAGLVGWFFVITEFIKSPPEQQAAYAASHEIDMLTHEYTDGRYALSWEELREIDRRHVVASHARSHVLLSRLDLGQRESEVVGSQRDFEQHLGHPVRSFVSYGGPPYGEDALTDRLIDQAGYQMVFSNLKIQRLRPW